MSSRNSKMSWTSTSAKIDKWTNQTSELLRKLSGYTHQLHSFLFNRSAMEDCMLSAGYHTPGKFRGTSVCGMILKSFSLRDFWQAIRARMLGSGRRSRPGISLGLQMVHVTLASFLHSFEVAKPSNEGHVDMTQSPGLTNLKATPLQVLLKPRLSFKVYGT